MIRLLMFLTILGLTQNCKVRQTESEVSNQAADTELLAVYNMLSSHTRIGACEFTSELQQTPQRQHLSLGLKKGSIEDETDNLKDVFFFNKQRNLGHVVIDRGFFDRTPYQIRLERTILEAQARRFQILIKLENNRPVSLHYKITRGHAGNILKEIRC